MIKVANRSKTASKASKKIASKTSKKTPSKIARKTLRKTKSKSTKTVKVGRSRKPTKVVERDNISEYRLSNGLKVLLLPNNSAPVVTVLVLFKVGSRNEAVGFTGATHFLEHMLFKGTKKHNAEKGNGIDELLTQVGAYWNATTWFDRTSYFEVVPSEYLELCLSLEADRMRNLRLRQEDRDSEMSVVRNELERGENHPDEALEKELYAIAFREHPYHHPTIGWRCDVEGVPMERLREFYDTFYWPDNATLVVVGDFKSATALEMVDKYFGQIKAAPRPIPPVYTIEPPQEGERRFEVQRSGDLPRVWIGYHVPEADHKDTYTLSAIRHILGGTYERSSRLYSSLIDSGIACDAFARHCDLRDPGLFIVGAMLNPGVESSKAEEILHAELAKLAQEKVSADELKRAQIANRKTTTLAKAEPSSLAFMLGEAESKADWHWLIDYDDKFDAVTIDDIKAAAAKYFAKSNRTVGHFIPRHNEPTIIAEPSVISETNSQNVSKEKKKELNGKGKTLKFDPSKPLRYIVPQVKVKRPQPPTTHFEKRVEKRVLSNGLTLMLMHNSGTNSLGISGLIKAGKYFSYRKNSNLGDLMIELLPKGSAHYDKTAIAQALENMGIPGGLDFSIDNFRVSFGTHLVASDLKEYSKLLADILRNPNFSEDELSKTKVEWQARFQEAMNSTKMLAWNKLRQVIYPSIHPFHEKPFTEELEELPLVSRDSILGLHQESFSPASTIISLVGDIDLDHAANIFENALSDWKGNPALTIDIPKVPLPAKSQLFEIELADKASADIVMGHPCELRRTNADFYSAKLANAVLGQDTITSRLGQIIREKAGLTYGIYSSFSDSAYGEAPWSVSLSVNPCNVDQVLGLVSRVLEDYRKKGINEDELKKEVGRAVGSFKVGLASSLGIAKALTEFEFLGLGAAALDVITDQYLAVTKKSANEAVQKYMHSDKAITVVSGSLNKKH